MAQDISIPAHGAGGPRDAAGGRSQRGSALIELALMLPILIFLVIGVLDVGHLTQQRMILTNVSREGGSLGSREDPFGANLLNVLVASGSPLRLGGADGRVIVTRLKAGASAADPDPVISERLSAGSLGVDSSISDQLYGYGLTTNLYRHLVFNSANQTADISQVTVVEVFYRYRPLTALFRLLGMTGDDGSFVISSRSFY
jgi:hypothetical protein